METPTDIVKYQEDYSDEENKSLQEYIKSGCPGIVKVDEVKTFEWFNLYMSGKNYGEISKICNVKKEMVLYFANKLKWHEKRMAYYGDLSSSLIHKTQAVKVESASTIAAMVSAMNIYFGDKFVNYLKTRDSAHIEGVDSKMLAQYYKSLEMLDKLMGMTPTAPPPAGAGQVHVHTSGSAKIEQAADGSTVITDNGAKDILSALAKYKKQIQAEED